MKFVPKSISSRYGGPLISTQDENGVDVPQNTTYLVSVPVENDDGQLIAGATGKAKIRVGYQTLGQRVWRLLCATFRFEL
jgi:putative peptide zinc metalloprotease protein